MNITNGKYSLKKNMLLSSIKRCSKITFLQNRSNEKKKKNARQRRNGARKRKNGKLIKWQISQISFKNFMK